MNFKDINKKIFKVFVFGILLISIGLIAIDIRGFGGAIKGFDIKYLPIILLLVGLNYLFRFIKWDYYLKQMNISISLSDNIQIFFANFPMTITPGKVGEFLKSYLLKIRYNYPISTTSPLVIIERSTDAIGMIILAGIGALAFNFGIGVLGLILALIMVGIIVIQSKKLCYGIIGTIANIPLVKKYVPFITNFYESACSLLKVKTLIFTIAIGMIAWSCEGLIVYCAAKSVGIDISIKYSIFILALSSIAGVVSMLPGGVIASEGSMLGLLFKIGVSTGSASFIVLLVRIATLWIGVCVGSLFLLRLERIWISNNNENIDIIEGDECIIIEDNMLDSGKGD